MGAPDGSAWGEAALGAGLDSEVHSHILVAGEAGRSPAVAEDSHSLAEVGIHSLAVEADNRMLAVVEGSRSQVAEGGRRIQAAVEDKHILVVEEGSRSLAVVGYCHILDSGTEDRDPNFDFGILVVGLVGEAGTVVEVGVVGEAEAVRCWTSVHIQVLWQRQVAGQEWSLDLQNQNQLLPPECPRAFCC